MSDIPELHPQILKAINNKRLVLFIGAGLSNMAGIGSWKDLREKLVKEFTIKKNEEDPDGLKKFLLNHNDFYTCFRIIKEHDESTYNEVMKKFLTPSHSGIKKFTHIFDCLKSLGAVSIVTLNIDSLLADYHPYGGRRNVRMFDQCYPWEIDEGRLFCFHGLEDNMGGSRDGWVFNENELI